MRYSRTIIGYHGCTSRTAARIFRGAPFSPSNNDYDWLGRGIYFWEHGPDRALRFIMTKLRREKRREKPAVVGALLTLGYCFDLLDTSATSSLAKAYPEFVKHMRIAGQALPRNRGAAPDLALRYLDCGMLNWYLAEHWIAGQEFQTVRGCFAEGGPAFPGSGIQRESHVQIAVRDPACIIGTFRPILDPMPRSRNKKDPFALAHARVMEKVRNATPEEMIESLKRAGILTKSGRFAKPYQEFRKLPRSKQGNGIQR